MAALFGIRLAEAQRAGRLAVITLWIRTFLDLITHGLSERRAIQPGGSGTMTSESIHDGRFSRRILHGWLTDVRHSVRALRRAKGHVIAVVFCVSVGAAASASMFSIVNGLFFTGLPGITDRDRLLRVFVVTQQTGAMPSSAVSTNDVEILRKQDAVAARLASEGELRVATVMGGEAMSAVAAFVSGNYFQILGAQPSRGRLLTESDDRAGASPVVVVSDLFWRRQFAERPDIVGQPIVIGGRSLTIVGVAPERFSGLDRSEIGDRAGSRLHFWLPLSSAAGWPGAPRPIEAWHSLVLRMPPQATVESTVVELNAAWSGPVSASGGRPVHFSASPLSAGPSRLRSDAATIITLFLCIPIAVLGIGCANVANLQLARATERTREVSVRLSLGASRAKIVRLLTTEAALLVLLAGATSILGTLAMLKGAESFVPVPLAVDWRVVAFLLTLVIGVVLLVGLAPAWLVTRQSVGVGLRQTPHAGGLAHSKLRATLVAGQVALSLILLVTSALFARSVETMYVGAPDVTHELLVGDVHLDQVGYDGGRARHFLDDIEHRLGADSRIRGVAAQGRGTVRYGWVEAQNDLEWSAESRYVTASWFGTMDVRAVVGRLFTATDGPTIAVVNQRLANQLSAGRSALGQTLRVRESDGAAPQLVRIVGVIANTPQAPDPHDDPAIYLPMPSIVPTSLSIAIRTPDPATLLPEVRRVLSALDPRLPWTDLTTGDALFSRRVSPVRYLVLLVGGLGALALFLAAAGLYAVMSYGVSLRRHEIGVRMAIGARPADVVAMVFRQALRIVAVGLLVGVALAVPVTSSIGFLFVGVSRFDATAMGLPVVVLIVAAFLAGAIPAQRAALVNPVQTLRED